MRKEGKLIQSFRRLIARSRAMLLALLAAGAFAALTGAAMAQAPSPWPHDEMVAKMMARVLHWGRPGENAPNAGWSAYRRFVMVEPDGTVSAFHWNGREFLAIVEVPKRGPFVALLYPGSVLLYHYEKPLDCTTDAIEYFGIGVELVQLKLAAAFPKGPASITGEATRAASGDPTEVRFMGGVLPMKAGWNASISAGRTAEGDVEFELNEKKGVTRGQWSDRPLGSPIADDNPLAGVGWKACPADAGTFPTIGALRASLAKGQSHK